MTVVIKKKLQPRQQAILISLVVIIVLILAISYALSRGPNVDHEAAAAEQDFQAAVTDIDLLSPGELAEETLPQSECSMKAILYIADGPGKPQAAEDETSRKDPETIHSAQLTSTTFSPVQSNLEAVTASTLIPFKPIYPVQPIKPIIIDPPSSWIQVLNPEEGSKLTAGSNFTLEWTIDSGRDLTVDILFSTDGGKTYQEIVKGIDNENSYRLKIPSVESATCVFRVNAWVGTALLGHNLSPQFQVVPPPLPTPPAPSTPEDPPETPPVTPSVPEPEKPTYPPSEYIAGNNAFVSEYDDAPRWFSLEHDLSNVKQTVWQLSRIPFPCESTLPLTETPGLLAWGTLDGDKKEFAVDFKAIISQLTAEGDAQTPAKDSIAIQTVPGAALLGQTQRELYVRVVLLDEKDKVIGATRSEFQVIYGQPQLEQSFIGILNPLPDLPRPQLQIKTTAGFAAGAYKSIPANGAFIYAGGNRDWSFNLKDIPIESVEIDLQISTLPFKYQKISDYQNPAGLVHRSQVTGLSYTTVSKVYNISFGEFAPPLIQLGENTINYYIRAVCYVPGEGTGTVIPVASVTHQIHYTGDKDLYLLGQIDVENLPPEEVVVKSYVPDTQFWRYYPAQWPLKDHEEYFEVTRPIQAEEINFYIKNSNTGDFLFPYPVHMNLYPQTTRAQYQATVDRMLPPGAWFRLTITQSNWDAIWSEFTELLEQVYTNIQQQYNGLKTSLANLVADRFAFMGSTVQGYIRTAVRSLIDYGLASVGLPPSLPNFEELTDASLDYCVRIALEEAAVSMGVPPEEIPNEVRNEIIDESKNQLNNLTKKKYVNPLNVGYLKPATQAMYRPAWVDVNVHNPHDQRSPSGTLTISYYPVGKPHFRIYKYVSLPVPSLAPNSSTFIRVHLKTDNTDLPVWKEYYWGDIGECVLNLRVTYDVPDVETAAKEQGVSGVSEHRPDAFVYDVDPVFTLTRTSAPYLPISD